MARAQAQGQGLVQGVLGQGRGHAQGQAAALLQRVQGRPAMSALHAMHAQEAARVQARQGRRQGRRAAFGIGGADGLFDQFGRLLQQDAAGRSARVAEDAAARWIGRVLADTGPAQGLAVDPKAVVVAGGQGDRMRRRGLVQKPAVREGAARPMIAVPAGALDPLARARAPGALGDQTRRRAGIGAAGQFDAFQPQGPVHQVGVAVGEAGPDHRPAGVPAAQAALGDAGEVGFVADADDAAGAQEQGLGLGQARVQGADARPGE